MKGSTDLPGNFYLSFVYSRDIAMLDGAGNIVWSKHEDQPAEGMTTGWWDFKKHVIDVKTAKTADIHSFNDKFSKACGSAQRVDGDLYVVSFGAATKDPEYMAVIDFATGEQLLSVTLDNPQDFTYRCVYFE